MIEKKFKYHNQTFVLGWLFLATYFLSDYLYERFWVFYLFPLWLLGIAFFIFFILTITQNNKKGILIGALIIGIILISELFSSELFKSKRVLEATLKDDLSSIHLILRADNKFVVVSSTMFNEHVFKGDYHFLGNKIIFKDKRYDNEFIPDTLTIIGDKIIFRFDKSGKPVIDFATYFTIERIEMKSAQ